LAPVKAHTTAIHRRNTLYLNRSKAAFQLSRATREIRMTNQIRNSNDETAWFRISVIRI